MSHPKIDEKLSAYYDQRLSQPERWEVESHLQDCPPCRQTLRQWQSTASFLFAKPFFSEWNEDLFTQKVMTRLDAKPVSIFAWKPLVQWSIPLVGSLAATAWIWCAVLPNLPVMASDSSFLDESGTQLASTDSVAVEAGASAPFNPTVSLISYDGGQ
ncbi:MAG: anti-sigma factor family protein [bacterium]